MVGVCFIPIYCSVIFLLLFASPWVELALLRLPQHLLWATITLFFCDLHPALWMCSTVSIRRASVDDMSFLLSLLQSSHPGLARTPILCSHFCDETEPQQGLHAPEQRLARDALLHGLFDNNWCLFPAKTLLYRVTVTPRSLSLSVTTSVTSQLPAWK
jgi:hypothetical protein